MRIVYLLMVIVIYIAITIKFASIAGEKGHSEVAYFLCCLFLPGVGHIMVAALPDMTVRNLISMGKVRRYTEDAAPGLNEWKCSKCGKVNPDYTGTCSCGNLKQKI